MVGPLLKATQRRFVLTGDTAADTCGFLNGANCQCKPRADATGELVMSEPPRAGDSQMIAGVGAVRTSDPISNASQHLQIALRAPTRLDRQLERSPAIAHEQDDEYVDFHGRHWQTRKW